MRSSGCLLLWLVLLQGTESRHAGFSSCGAWAPWLQPTGSRVLAQYLRCVGLVAAQRVRSSQTRDQPGSIPDQHLPRPYALHWQGDSSPLDRQGSTVCVCLIRILVITRRAHPDSKINASSAAAAAKSRQSCLTVQPHRRQPTRLPHPWDSPGKNTGVGCHFLLQCMKVKSENEAAKSHPTLHDLIDCSLQGSSVHGIFQARVLEWVASAFSKMPPLESLNLITPFAI